MISIIIPVYNEEKNISFVIDSILLLFKKINLPFEVIAVNDGSEDKTEKILENYKKITDIIVVSHKKNLGYGAALRSGFLKATGDLIFFTDSDRQFNIKDILPFLDNIKGNDFIIGYRKDRKDSRKRILFATIFRFAARVFFEVRVRDVDCAFKLFKNYVLSDIKLISDGALINLEILAKAKIRGYKFIELPVSHFKRVEGKQTGGSLRVIFKAISQFFSLWQNVKTI
jgi:glycosyltransferase involved in cell wall biosynthesis